MSKKQTTEVAVKEVPQAVVESALKTISLEDFGMTEVCASDIKIPLALLMQKMSVMVDEEKAKAGEIRGSLEGNLLGGVDKEFFFVPLQIQNVWVEKIPATKKFVGVYPRTRLNEKQDLTYLNEQGEEVVRTKQIDVFCMDLAELNSGEALPYKLSFKVTSYDAGKTMITLATKLMMFGKPLYNYVFKVSTIKKENDKGTFYVFDLAQDKTTDGKSVYSSPSTHQLCQYWASQVGSGKVVAHDEADLDTSFDTKSFSEQKF